MFPTKMGATLLIGYTRMEQEGLEKSRMACGLRFLVVNLIIAPIFKTASYLLRMKEIIKLSDTAIGVSKLFIAGREIYHISISEELSKREYTNGNLVIRIDSNKIFDMAIMALCEKYPSFQNITQVKYDESEAIAGSMSVHYFDQLAGYIYFVLKLNSDILIIDDVIINGWQSV